MTVSVVGSLDVVKADVLIGNDVVTGSGGVHLQYTDGGGLIRVTFGNESSGADVSALSTDADDLKDHPSPHVRVTRDGADVTLTTDDGEVRWNSATRQSVMSWRWKDLHPPTGSIGHGVGEYSRAKLTPKQENLFASEVETWIENGWLVPHDEAKHGVPSCVLPLLPQVQEHKPSTPVRPCLDYREIERGKPVRAQIDSWQNNMAPPSVTR